MSSRSRLLLASAVVALAASPAMSQITFVETGAARGIKPYVMAEGPIGGVAAADYDNDGDIDLFVPTAEGFPDQLYANRGDGTFDEIAAASGLASLENHRAALWFDYDGDRDLDLAVGGDCRRETPGSTVPLSTDPCPNPANLRLYRQGPDGFFEDVTAAAGLDVNWGGRRNQHRGGIAAGDVDGDGWLDLHVTTWNGYVYLYRNNQDGTFTDVTAASGIDTSQHYYQMPIMADFNGDSRLDIYAAVDFGVGNFLWLNQGDGTFVDGAPAAGIDDAWTDMGLDLGDYDNDGDADLYVTNVTYIQNGEYQHSVFYRNDSQGADLSYSEISIELGLDNGHWGWGTIFLDADNDGLLDLASTNGKNFDRYAYDPSRSWRNVGGDPVAFEDVGAQVGFDDTFMGSSLIAFDADRDGDLDVVQATMDGGLRLLENRPGRRAARNHWLAIQPRMSGANHFAIGAVVRVETGDGRMMRILTAGMSTLGEQPAEAFFGLGRRRWVNNVTVEWPDGRVTALGRERADRVLTITNYCPAPSTGVLSVVSTPSGAETGIARWPGRVT